MDPKSLLTTIITAAGIACGGIACGGAETAGDEETAEPIAEKSDGYKSILGKWHTDDHDPSTYGEPIRLVLEADGRRTGRFHVETRGTCPTGKVCLPSSGAGTFTLSRRWFTKTFVTFEWGDGQALKYEWEFVTQCGFFCQALEFDKVLGSGMKSLALRRVDETRWMPAMLDDYSIDYCDADSDCNGKLSIAINLCPYVRPKPHDKCVRGWCRPGCEVAPDNSSYYWYY